MSARTRLRTAAAITTALTAGTAMLLTGCGPTDSAKTGTGTGTTAAPTATATASKAPVPTPTKSAAPALNGTAHNGLTISNGTETVVMNGTTVNFGTKVRDLAWSPDGRKAAFVNGSGDLMVSNPDGSGKVVVAKNPGGQTWSHPTWQVAAASAENHVPAKNNIFFAADQGGVIKLEGVSATAVNGTPHVLSLNTESDDNPKPLPQTGNIWPSAGGQYGSAAYANSGTGEVFVRDEYLRQQGSAVTKGSQPALHDREIAFIRSVGGHDHLFERNEDGKEKDLTPHATTDYTEPAWSKDGRTIAVRTPDGIWTVPGDGSAAPTKVSDYIGLPAYRG